MRLIDADFTKKTIENYIANNEVSESFVEIAGLICAMLDDCETVEAVEVVHGRWEDMYGGHYVNPRFRCSACNEKALYKFARDMLGNYKEVQELTPYCPYCMAKMDLDVSSDEKR